MVDLPELVIGKERFHQEALIHAPRSLSKRLKHPTAASIELSPGEYDGPSLISQPLHLRGRGRSTVLWSYEVPVLIIMAPNVILENLLFDVSTILKEPIILYADECEPKIINCQPSELKVIPMSAKDDLINLGTLTANTQVALPIILQENAVGYGLDPAPIYATLSKLPLSRHRQRGFIFTIRPPSSEGLLVENFNIINQKDKAKLDVLLYGEVVTKPNRTLSYPRLRLGKTKQVIHIQRGLELTSEHLQLATQGQFRGLKGLYAYFIAEGDREWSLWLPHTPPSPIKYEGKEVRKWQRIVLKEGQRFNVAGVELVVQDGDKPSLEIPTSLGTEVRTLENHRFSANIANKGFLKLPRTWKGRAETFVPWLNVDNILNAKGDAQFELQINDKIGDLPNGHYIFRDVIALFNDTDFHFIDLNLNLDIPHEMVSIQPETLRIPVEGDLPLYTGELEGRGSGFKLQNFGREDITLDLHSNFPWLEIPPSACHFTLKHGQPYDIPIRLTSHANKLQQGYLTEKQALSISTSKNNWSLALTLDIQASRIPVIGFTSPRYTLPTYNLARPVESVLMQVEIVNPGVVEGAFTLSSNHAAVQPLQPSGILKPQEKLTINVRLSPDTLKETSPTSIPVILTLKSGLAGEDMRQSDQTTLTIVIVDVYPKLSLQPTIITIGSHPQGSTVDYTTTIAIKNEGTESFHGQLELLVPWISTISQTILDLTYGQEVKVRLEVNHHIRTLNPGQYSKEILQLKSNTPLKHPVSLTAQIEILTTHPIIRIPYKFLWLGQIEQGTNQPLKQQSITIANYGNTIWHGELKSNVAWLEIGQTKITIPPQKALTIPVRINDRIHRMPLGANYVSEVISVSENDPIGVRFILSKPAPRIQISDSVLDFGRLSQGDELPESRFIQLENTGALPWQGSPEHFYCPQWLEINRDPRLSLSPGEKMSLELTLKRELMEQSGMIRDYVRFSDGEHSAEMEVTVHIIEVDISMKPETLLLSASRRLRNPLSNNLLTFTNLGEAPFNVVVKDAKDTGNLEVPEGLELIYQDRSIFLNPREERSFTVQISNPDWLGNQGDFILTLPNGQQRRVAVIIL